MKKILLFAMGLAMSASTLAEETEKVETTIAGDIVSSYIWRGLDAGSTAVQPTIGIGYKGLSLTAWGSYGLTNPDDTKEFDLTLGYSVGGFNIGITDYWNTDGQDPENRYFRYNAHSTNHLFEANVGYDFGPLSLQWNTMFAGNDGYNKSGERAYSSYIEAAAPFALGGCEWQAVLGAVPYATDYYGADGFIINNVSLRAQRDIKITDKFSLPVFGQIAVNPSTEHAYFVFGFTLKAF